MDCSRALWDIFSNSCVDNEIFFVRFGEFVKNHGDYNTKVLEWVSEHIINKEKIHCKTQNILKGLFLYFRRDFNRCEDGKIYTGIVNCLFDYALNCKDTEKLNTHSLRIFFTMSLEHIDLLDCEQLAVLEKNIINTIGLRFEIPDHIVRFIEIWITRLNAFSTRLPKNWTRQFINSLFKINIHNKNVLKVTSILKEFNWTPEQTDSMLTILAMFVETIGEQDLPSFTYQLLLLSKKHSSTSTFHIINKCFDRLGHRNGRNGICPIKGSMLLQMIFVCKQDNSIVYGILKRIQNIPFEFIDPFHAILTISFLNINNIQENVEKTIKETFRLSMECNATDTFLGTRYGLICPMQILDRPKMVLEGIVGSMEKGWKDLLDNTLRFCFIPEEFLRHKHIFEFVADLIKYVFNIGNSYKCVVIERLTDRIVSQKSNMHLVCLFHRIFNTKEDHEMVLFFSGLIENISLYRRGHVNKNITLNVIFCFLPISIQYEYLRPKVMLFFEMYCSVDVFDTGGPLVKEDHDYQKCESGVNGDFDSTDFIFLYLHTKTYMFGDFCIKTFSSVFTDSLKSHISNGVRCRSEKETLFARYYQLIVFLTRKKYLDPVVFLSIAKIYVESLFDRKTFPTGKSMIPLSEVDSMESFLGFFDHNGYAQGECVEFNIERFIHHENPLNLVGMIYVILEFSRRKHAVGEETMLSAMFIDSLLRHKGFDFNVTRDRKETKTVFHLMEVTTIYRKDFVFEEFSIFNNIFLSMKGVGIRSYLNIEDQLEMIKRLFVLIGFVKGSGVNGEFFHILFYYIDEFEHSLLNFNNVIVDEMRDVVNRFLSCSFFAIYRGLVLKTNTDLKLIVNSIVVRLLKGIDFTLKKRISFGYYNCISDGVKEFQDAPFSPSSDLATSHTDSNRLYDVKTIFSTLFANDWIEVSVVKDIYGILHNDLCVYDRNACKALCTNKSDLLYQSVLERIKREKNARDVRLLFEFLIEVCEHGDLEDIVSLFAHDIGTLFGNLILNDDPDRNTNNQCVFVTKGTHVVIMRCIHLFCNLQMKEVKSVIKRMKVLINVEYSSGTKDFSMVNYLETHAIQRLDFMIRCCSGLAHSSLTGDTAEVFFKTTHSLYAGCAHLAKWKAESSCEKSVSESPLYLDLLRNLGTMTHRLYLLIPFVQRLDMDDIKTRYLSSKRLRTPKILHRKINNKISKESRIIPGLIYQLEYMERYLFMIANHSRDRELVLSCFIRSTARDFRIVLKK